MHRSIRNSRGPQPQPQADPGPLLASSADVAEYLSFTASNSTATPSAPLWCLIPGGAVHWPRGCPAALSHCCTPTSAAVVTLNPRSDAKGVPMLVPHLRRRSYCRSCPSSAADQNMAASWGATSTLCSRLLWVPFPVQ